KIIEMDVGHPINAINEIEVRLDHNDVVFASRFMPGGKFLTGVPFKRSLLSKLGTIASKIFLQLPFSDCTSGLQGFNKNVLQEIPLDSFISKGHIYQTEMKYYCRYLRYEEIPINYAV